MSSSFNLPRNPADFRPPSPHAADGTNLFADSEPPSDAPATENPYGPPASNSAPAYVPTGYETTIPHRGGLVLSLGIASLGMLTLGVSLIAIYAWLSDLAIALILSPALNMNLVFSLSAWIMSWLDLKAIDAGAMRSEGRRSTSLGGWLGVLGTFLTLLLGLPSIVVAIYWFLIEIQR